MSEFSFYLCNLDKFFITIILTLEYPPVLQTKTRMPHAYGFLF